MILHASIESEEPQRVAKAIAEIWEDAAVPLDILVKQSWIAYCGGNPLSAIEVFPQGTNIRRSDGDQHWFSDCTPGGRPTPTQVALATKLAMEQVKAVADREGWETKFIKRGDRFAFIEMWMSEVLVIEWLTPDMMPKYQATMEKNYLQSIPH